jgi:ATP-binding cassette subfamily F protein uup
MALISLREVGVGFGGPPLLDGINLNIERGERVGLLGRNGMGKSSLLKLIYGDLVPDEGVITRQQNLCMAFLPQEIPEGLGGDVEAIVAAGLGTPAEALAPGSDQLWQRQLQVEQIISRMQLDPQAPFDLLSAGWKRRVLLARGLVRAPDLLLLDEPTNHLDIDAINWLEDFLTRWGGTLLFVTHDRLFLQHMTTRIVELDRGRLFDWNCNYVTFTQRKAAALTAEQEQNLNFDRKLSQEEQWIRQGIQARRTRNEGRVRALKRLRETRRERREQPGKVRMQIQEARRSGKLVIEAEGVCFSYDGRPIVRNFSTTIQRGDKVGIVGPNGAGKTTLLRLLLGQLAPQQGRIRHGTHLDVAYFDQLRDQLDEDKSLLDNVGQGSDTVTINGKTRSLVGYLEGFLFERAHLYSPIHVLSGGERNRLMLARLFTHPANLLVMDEPTNDLDLETLELLEDLLLEYSGTLLLVSHDRSVLNNLVTTTLVLDGDGRVEEYVGGYDDWRSQQQAALVERARRASRPASVPEASRDTRPRKPSYNEQRERDAQRAELASLPARIEALEAEQRQLSDALASTDFYQRDGVEISRAVERLKELDIELSRVMQRWEDLERLNL